MTAFSSRSPFRFGGRRSLAASRRREIRLRAPFQTSSNVGAALFLAVFFFAVSPVFVAATRANDAFSPVSPSSPTCPLPAFSLDDLFSPSSPPYRSSLFCELAGIDVSPLDSPRFADFTETASFASFDENASTARIERGAYLSNLPIVPFRGRFFVYGDASWGSQDKQNESPYASGFKVASFGGGVGQDWRLTKNAIWGYGFQGRNVRLDPDASIYEAEIDSFAGFLHLSLFGPLWRLDLSIGAGKSWNAQSESAFDALKYSSTQWNYEAEFGVRFDKGYTRVEPLVNFRVMTLQEPADAERRFVLVGRPSDYSDASYRLKLGSRFAWEYATHVATLKPFLTATWNHEFGDRALYVSGENTPFPILYRYAKHRMARDRLDLGGGVDAALRDTVDLFFRYDVEFAKEYANYLFYAGFHKKF